MLKQKTSLNTLRPSRKKSFFDIQSKENDNSFFDLDTLSSKTFKRSDSSKKQNHIEVIVNFSDTQLEDKAILEKLDAILDYQDLPKDTPLKAYIKSPVTARRSSYFKNVVLDSYKEIISKTKAYYEEILQRKITSVAPAYDIINTITKVFVTDRNIMLNLCNHETEDDFLYQHVVKTAIYSVNIAIALGYSQEDTCEIGVGALMSDIGMAAIAKNIRNFKGKYSKEENYLVRKHPIYSANILETLPDFPPTTALIAYQAHERSNGMGYPRERRENTIHRFSKIVAIADVYTALSSNRHHRKAFRPYEAIKRIIVMSNKGWFSKEIVSALLEFTSLFPVGSIVKLNNNTYGKVVSASSNSISTPVITIFTDEKGYKLAPKGYLITDLSVNTTVRIVGTKENHFLSTSLMTCF